jgi:hypothetical protein
MGYILLDLDNCISDDEWRINRIKQIEVCDEKYHDYHSLGAFDNYCNKDIVVSAIENDYSIVVVTGRPELYRAATEYWLAMNGIKIHSLLMRPNGDHSSASTLKFDMVFDFAFKENIIMAYDDRQDVIDAYSMIAIPAQRRFIHNKET